MVGLEDAIVLCHVVLDVSATGIVLGNEGTKERVETRGLALTEIKSSHVGEYGAIRCAEAVMKVTAHGRGRGGESCETSTSEVQSKKDRRHLVCFKERGDTRA